jgi:hypothetical protein
MIAVMVDTGILLMATIGLISHVGYYLREAVISVFTSRIYVRTSLVGGGRSAPSARVGRSWGHAKAKRIVTVTRTKAIRPLFSTCLVLCFCICMAALVTAEFVSACLRNGRPAVSSEVVLADNTIYLKLVEED